MERFALLVDRLIDRHPVLSVLTYIFSAACMTVFTVTVLSSFP